MKVAHASGEPVILSTSSAPSESLALDSAALYWTDGAALKRLAFDSSSSPTTLVANAADGNHSDIAVTADAVYFLSDPLDFCSV